MDYYLLQDLQYNFDCENSKEWQETIETHITDSLEGGNNKTH